jgi:hypothetical protein
VILFDEEYRNPLLWVRDFIRQKPDAILVIGCSGTLNVLWQLLGDPRRHRPELAQSTAARPAFRRPDRRWLCGRPCELHQDLLERRRGHRKLPLPIRTAFGIRIQVDGKLKRPLATLTPKGTNSNPAFYGMLGKMAIQRQSSLRSKINWFAPRS